MVTHRSRGRLERSIEVSIHAGVHSALMLLPWLLLFLCFSHSLSSLAHRCEMLLVRETLLGVEVSVRGAPTEPRATEKDRNTDGLNAAVYARPPDGSQPVFRWRLCIHSLWAQRSKKQFDFRLLFLLCYSFLLNPSQLSQWHYQPIQRFTFFFSFHTIFLSLSLW